MVQKKATDDCNITVELKSGKVFPKFFKWEMSIKVIAD
jgi:hypothetical protein